eukprot:GHVQ01038628.1.p1 GENE.GHVQ01038628.1~~GHVQ01038628.1.p1  ORF type:complete len:767 (-),score=92.76 GHVQ01038628.1:889-3189(-)
MADTRVFYAPSVSPAESYIGDDGEHVSSNPEFSSNSLKNLPPQKEAKQTFLFFICRHGPASTGSDGVAELYKNILLRNVAANENVLQVELSQLLRAHDDHMRCYRQDGRMSSPFRTGEGPQPNEAPGDAGAFATLTIHMGKGGLGRLHEALRRRPLWYLKDLEEVCKELVKHEFLKSEFTKDKLAPDIQILLSNTGSRTHSLRQLTVLYQEQLVVVPGIIIQASFPHPKLTQAALQCRYCDHRHTLKVPATKDKLILPRVCHYYLSMQSRNTEAAGLVEGLEGGFPEVLGCKDAKDPYYVMQNESTFTNVQSLKLQEFPEAVPVGDVPRSIMLNVYGHNAGELRPGERVKIHGVLSNYNPQGDVYEAENVPYVHVLRFDKVAQDHSEEMQFSTAEEMEFRSMAGRPDIHGSIFRSIAPALYGLNDVKKAIACVLFGGCAKKTADGSLLRGDINMLMLGDPSVAKSQVLKFAARASTISVYTSGKGSSAAGLTASVVRDKHGVFALEGGAMVLADGGIVCIDEFDKMRDEDIVAMHEAMEQQTISINKAGISTMLNARCSVVAAANPTFGSYDDSQDSSEQHEMKSTILSRFDVIFMLRDKQDVEKDAAMARHILALHEGTSTVFDGDIPLEKLRRYIQYSRQSCSPRLSTAACEKLRTFYVETRAASREDKRSSTKKIPITIRQLESLYRLTESFAKMQLLKEAGENHVEMAIEYAPSTLVFMQLLRCFLSGCSAFLMCTVADLRIALLSTSSIHWTVEMWRCACS